MLDHLEPASADPLSRRNIIFGAVGALAALVGSTAFFPGPSQEPAPPPNRDASGNWLHQEIDLKTTSAKCYALRPDPKQFTAFSNQPADIHPEARGAFSMFGARILGRNVELLPNQRIVQAGRSAGWPTGVYSIVHLEIKELDTQTHVILDHSGFPVGQYDNLFSGWHSHYGDPLEAYFQ